MPESVFTKIKECRKNLEGKTGMAINGFPMLLAIKYEESDSVPTEQLVLDMRELLSTERVVLDAIITLFVKLGHGSEPEALRERG